MLVLEILGNFEDITFLKRKNKLTLDIKGVIVGWLILSNGDAPRPVILLYPNSLASAHSQRIWLILEK